MNCPGCHKELINNLSVCFACGTMKNDTVREELAVKVTAVSKKPPQLTPQFKPFVIS